VHAVSLVDQVQASTPDRMKQQQASFPASAQMKTTEMAAKKGQAGSLDSAQRLGPRKEARFRDQQQVEAEQSQ
jgi:hypothetical protein